VAAVEADLAPSLWLHHPAFTLSIMVERHTVLSPEHTTSYEAMGMIDPATLERLARIAQGLPGRTISLTRPPTHSQAVSSETHGTLLVRVDGIAATEVVAGYEDD
jgi:hypothetical protein